MDDIEYISQLAAAIRAACRRGGYKGDPIENFFKTLSAAIVEDPEETARILRRALFD